MDGLFKEVVQLWPDGTECDNVSAPLCGPIAADEECAHNISCGNLSRAANYASEQFLNESRFWIQRVLVPFVVGVGVLGNLVTIVVLTRRRMRSSTNVYLTALAVSDLLYLVFMFSLSLEHYPNSNDPAYYVYWQYWKYGLWLTDATSSTSIWLTVSFTIERYIAVCHPMRGRLLCTESRARKVILLVYAFCFLTTITTPFEWQIATELDPADNATVVAMKETNLSSNTSYRTIFYWFWSITFVFLPLILLGIFNSFLIHAVHKSQRQRCQMTQVDQSDSVQTQENKITITLIAVVVVFMFCQIPSAILLICSLFYTHQEKSPEDNVTRGLGNIFNFLVAINAACNFLLYCALSDKYRRTFLLTFLGRWYRTPSQLHSMSCYNSRYTVDGPTRQSMRVSTNTMSRNMTYNGTVRKQNGVQPQPSAQQQVVAQNNVHVPLLESLKYQFLIHGLPIPHKLDQQNSDIVSKPQLEQDNV